MTRPLRTVPPLYPPHWRWNDFARSFQPHAFRPPHNQQRKPVKGGRWEVRKVQFAGKPLRPWQAKTRGSAKYLSRRFASQEEATAWAHRVAAAFALKGYERERAITRLRGEKFPHTLKTRQSL